MLSGCQERKQISVSEGQKKPPQDPGHLGTQCHRWHSSGTCHVPGAKCCPFTSFNPAAQQAGGMIIPTYRWWDWGKRRWGLNPDAVAQELYLIATPSSFDAEALVWNEQRRSLQWRHSRGMGETLGNLKRGKTKAFRRFPVHNAFYELDCHKHWERFCVTPKKLLSGGSRIMWIHFRPSKRASTGARAQFHEMKKYFRLPVRWRVRPQLCRHLGDLDQIGSFLSFSAF